MTSEPAVVGWPTERALWASTAETLRDVVLPGVDDPHHRQVVIHMIGLATYARDRGADPTPVRVTEVAAILDALAGDGNTAVGARWSGGARDADTVMRVASDVLADAVESGEPDAIAAKQALRACLIRHLDADLATEQVLLDAFRGRLPDG